LHSLVTMLTYKRKHGTESIKNFCSRYLHPIFGHPDKDGNYVLIVGDKPNILYAAHYDSVHKTNGMQKVKVSAGIVTLHPDNEVECLGADCATGIWLILEMIDAGIQGVYVVHAQEETGCLGSQALVNRLPYWLDSIDAVISFDRKGQSDIITHQMGMRTASDAFARSLADILKLGHKPDDGGAYTDSNEYASTVSECTNLAVGYTGQHTAKEAQDLEYASTLRDALIEADWSQLVFKRDPSVVEYIYGNDWGYPFRGFQSYSYAPLVEEDRLNDYREIIQDYDNAVAALLADYFQSPYDLLDELQRYGADPFRSPLLRRYK